MPKVSSYTITKKLEVLEWHKQNGSNVSRTSRQFKIDRKRIREWSQNETILLQNNYGERKFLRKLSSGRPVFSEEIDDSLFEFFEQQRQAGLAVSNRLLGDEAVAIANRLGLTFKASNQYLKRWKTRFNVSMRRGTNDSQKLPEDHIDAIAAFFTAVNAKRQVHNYSMFNIANMDQTMVRFDTPAERTNHLKGDSTVRIVNTGCKKRGFTVSLAGHASGHKLPAFMIFKEPSGRIPPKAFAALRIPANVKVTASVNGWMTTEKMQEWLSRIWKGNEDDVRRLLILDLAPIHKSVVTQQRIAESDTDLVFIPGGCTSILQPADVAWNKPFKDSLRRSWAEFSRKLEKTPKGNLKKPSRQDMINFVSRAWESVATEIVEKSFKSCGLSNALDGSENGLFSSKLADLDLCTSQDATRELIQECQELIFHSDSEESFDGFTDEESTD